MKRLEIKTVLKKVTYIETYYIADIYNGTHSLVIRRNNKSIRGGQENQIQDATQSWCRDESKSWDEQIAELSAMIQRIADCRIKEEAEDPIGDIITLIDEDDLPAPIEG